MTIEKLMEEIKQDKVCRAELLHQSLQESRSVASADEESYEQNADQRMREAADMILADDVNLTGNADAVHNIAVEYARENYYDIACRLLQKALAIKKYAYNIDLLADYLKYSTCFSDNDQEQADLYLVRLMSINKKRWNWRAYEFSIDYLLEEMKSTADSFETKIGDVLRLAEEYKDKFRDTEYADRAYHELADVHMENDDQKASERVLREAVRKLKKAPSCAMQLADSYYKRGSYREASEYIKQCILMNNELESTINKGYPYILYALCQIREVYENMDEDGMIDKEFAKKYIKKIESWHESAKLCMEKGNKKTQELKQQIDLLKKWTGIDSTDMEEYGE